MAKMKFSSLLVVWFAVLWMLAQCGSVQAQGKGWEQEKDRKNKDTEQVTKEKGWKGNKGGEKPRGEKEGGAVQGRPAHYDRYTPKAVTEEEMVEWADGNPPGWSRGKKTGWRGESAPPGQMKKQGEQTRKHDREMRQVYPPYAREWDAGKKEEWNAKLERARKRVIERLKTRGVGKGDAESALISLENGARQGVPLETAEAVINKAISKRMPGEDIEKITRAMSYGVDKDTDYDKLGRFVTMKMDDGESGNDIARSIYKKIDDGAMRENKTWFKGWFNR